MKRSNKKSLEVVTSSIFYFIVVVLVFYILVELLLPKQTVKIFGFKPYSVITRSMEPVIMDGDFIIVGNAKYDELVPQDIISFYADFDNDGKKEIITHYIASVNDDGARRTYKTQGYERPIDSWILTDSDILGVYSFKIPYLGKFVTFLKTPLGIAVLVLNVAVIILLKINIDKFRNKKKIETKKDT
ncbi:MAG: signal peptidase I [Candidatus Izemoplasmatales bacterium]